jgi:protein ImuA
MTHPTALTVARNRAVVMEELRRLLPGGMDGLRPTLRFGLGALDSYLPHGGLDAGALHEAVPETEGCIAAALGFIAAFLARLFSPPPESERAEGRLVDVSTRTDPAPARRADASLSGEGKVIFIMPAYGFRHYGRLHGHGLNGLGFDPARLILVETAHRKETLWAIEEALRSAAPAAVAGMIDKLDLKTSQRLHLAATDAGLPLLLLRPAQTLESSAATTRWRIGTAEAARDRFGLFARPRWHLRLERCRNGRPGEWVVEYDHVAHRFSLAAALADSARSRGASEKPVAKAHRA